MMGEEVAKIVHYRFLILAIAAAIMVAGYFQLRGTSLDVLPEFSPPLIEIQTEALGLSAEEVEALITVPMEADLLNGISWIKTIRSQSMPGLSSILMVFEDGTDIWNARLLVQERLSQAHTPFALPNVSRAPTMLQPLSSTSRVMLVGLSSSKLSNIEISVQAHWVMRPRLMGVAGVANVSIWGERNRQLQVQVDPKRLSTYGIKLQQILSTAGNALWYSPLSFLNASTPGSGGFIDTPNQRLTIRHVLPISTPDQLANVAVEGTEYTLGDVANIVEDHQPLIGDALVGNGPGVLLVIEKFPWADTVAVTEGIDAALEDLRPSLSGVDIDPSIYRQADFIEEATANLWLVALSGIILLTVALVLFFRDWRVVLVSIVSIPVSLMAAAFVMYHIGIGFDVIMMAGLTAVVGVIINDAVVDAGMVRRGRREGDPPLASLIGQTLARSRGALIFASLVVLTATVPMLVPGGVPGAIMESVVVPFVVGVIVSTVGSLTLTPALCYILLSSAGSTGTARAPAAAGSGSGRWAFVETARRPIAAVAAALALVAVGFAAFSERSIIPTFKERSVVANLTAAPGTSHQAMVRITSQMVSELRQLPGVRSAGAHIGRAITSDAVANVNSAQIWLHLDDAADYDESLAAVGKIIDGYPGAEREVVKYSDVKTRQFSAEAADTLRVRVFGYELGKLQDVAEQVRGVVSGIEGLSDVAVQPQVLEPVVKIEPDLAKCTRFGIKPGDVRRAAAVILSGLSVGSLFEEQKVFEVVVWGVPEVRRSVTDIGDLLIDAPGGGHVRLGDVANVSIGSLPQVIRRDAVSRYLDITARATGDNVSAVAADVKGRIAQMTFPLEYHAEVLSDYAEARAMRSQLILAMLAAMIGIFLLIQASVRSWSLGAATFVALLAAMSGGVIVVALTGMVMSLGAIAGLLGVLAVASRGALLLIRHYQALEQEGGSFGIELIARGTRERRGAILATGFGTALAVAPAALLASLAGLESLGPVAWVLIGGMITTAAVNLVVVPTLYLMFGAGSAAAETDLVSEETQYHAA